MNTLYVGIDISSKSNVVYMMLPNGDKHSNFSVASSHEGSVQLVKRIYSALTSHSLDTVLIGLEATSVYGDNLVYFLREMLLWHHLTVGFMSSILSKSRGFMMLTMTCQRMIMWTLLLSLIACVLVESTKRYIREIIAIKHSETSHEHVSSLSKILSKKNSDL